MKISVRQLRRLIREVLVNEQGWVPGRWYPGSGKPVDDDEIETMARGGMGKEDSCSLEEDELGES